MSYLDRLKIRMKNRGAVRLFVDETRGTAVMMRLFNDHESSWVSFLSDVKRTVSADFVHKHGRAGKLRFGFVRMCDKASDKVLFQYDEIYVEQTNGKRVDLCEWDRILCRDVKALIAELNVSFVKECATSGATLRMFKLSMQYSNYSKSIVQPVFTRCAWTLTTQGDVDL